MGKLSFLFKSKSDKPVKITVDIPSPTPPDEKFDLSPIPEVATPLETQSPTPVPEIHEKAHAEAGTGSQACCNMSISAEADARNSHCCLVM